MDNPNAKYMIPNRVRKSNFRVQFPREQHRNKSGSIFSTVACTLHSKVGFSADFYAEVQDLVYGWLSLIIHSILRAKHVFVRTRFRHEIVEITATLYLISAIKWVSSLFLFNYFSFEGLAIYVNINFSIFYEDWNFGMYSHCQTY